MNFFDLPKDLINIVYQFDNTYKEKFDKVVKEIRDIMTPISDEVGEDYYPLKLNKKRFPFFEGLFFLKGIINPSNHYSLCRLKSFDYNLDSELDSFSMSPHQLLLWARQYTHNKYGLEVKFDLHQRVPIIEREDRYCEYNEEEMEEYYGYW